MNEWYSRQCLILLAFHWFLKDAVRPVATCFAIYKKKRKKKMDKSEERRGNKEGKEGEVDREAAGPRNIIQ